MFNIDMLMEDFSGRDLIREDMKQEEKANMTKAKKLAKEFADELMRMGYAIQGYDKNYRNLIPDAQRKVEFKKAATELKATIVKAGIMLKDGTLYQYPEFRMDLNRWNMLKKIADEPEKMFADAGSEQAKNVAKELAKLAVEIKKKNWVDPSDTSSMGFAKDMADDKDQALKYNALLSKIRTADKENDLDDDSEPEDKKLGAAIDKGMEDLEKRTTKDAKAAYTTRKKYLDDIRNAKETGRAAPTTVQKMVDRTAVGAGVRRKGLDEVRKADVEALKKDDNVKLNDGKETGFEFKGQKYKNVKLLCQAWAEAKVPMQGQIKIISKTNRFNKPILMIDGKLYIVPRNDIVSNARGGIGTKDSPYNGYTETCTRSAEYKELREKFK